MAYLPMISGGGGANSVTLLWENSAPTSNFSAQTIQLNLSNIDYLLVVGKNQPNIIESLSVIGGTELQGLVKVDDTDHPVPMGWTTWNSGYYIVRRNVKANSSGVTFSGGLQNGENPRNDRAIPLRIYSCPKEIAETLYPFLAT